MFKKLVAGALFAGFAAGLIAVLLQFLFVTPLLVQAERYETGELTHVAQIGGHDHSAHDHPKAVPESQTGHDHTTHIHETPLVFDAGREGLTALFTVFVYVGYGLMLGAGFAFAHSLGHEITTRTGLLWGMAGFAALHLAPSFGLPIEMPGSAAADVVARQIWWAGTVVSTGLAMWMFAYGKGAMHIVLGIAALAVPQVIGAPHPQAFYGPTPPELASLFASRALVTALVAWSVLGAAAGYFWNTTETA